MTLTSTQIKSRSILICFNQSIICVRRPASSVGQAALTPFLPRLARLPGCRYNPFLQPWTVADTPKGFSLSCRSKSHAPSAGRPTPSTTPCGANASAANAASSSRSSSTPTRPRPAASPSVRRLHRPVPPTGPTTGHALPVDAMKTMIATTGHAAAANATTDHANAANLA